MFGRRTRDQIGLAVVYLVSLIHDRPMEKNQLFKSLKVMSNFDYTKSMFRGDLNRFKKKFPFSHHIFRAGHKTYIGLKERK